MLSFSYICNQAKITPSILGPKFTVGFEKGVSYLTVVKLSLVSTYIIRGDGVIKYSRPFFERPPYKIYQKAVSQKR